MVLNNVIVYIIIYKVIIIMWLGIIKCDILSIRGTYKKKKKCRYYSICSKLDIVIANIFSKGFYTSEYVRYHIIASFIYFVAFGELIYV